MDGRMAKLRRMVGLLRMLRMCKIWAISILLAVWPNSTSALFSRRFKLKIVLRRTPQPSPSIKMTRPKTPTKEFDSDEEQQIGSPDNNHPTVPPNSPASIMNAKMSAISISTTSQAPSKASTDTGLNDSKKPSYIPFAPNTLPAPIIGFDKLTSSASTPFMAVSRKKVRELEGEGENEGREGKNKKVKRDEWPVRSSSLEYGREREAMMEAEKESKGEGKGETKEAEVGVGEGEEMYEESGDEEMAAEEKIKRSLREAYK